MSRSVCQRYPGSSKVLISRWCQTDPRNRGEGVDHAGAESRTQGHSSSISAGPQERKLGSTPPTLKTYKSVQVLMRELQIQFSEHAHLLTQNSKKLKISSLVVTRIPKIQTLRTRLGGGSPYAEVFRAHVPIRFLKEEEKTA